jgi:RimJ/RimL family protein N-acetyltransferase
VIETERLALRPLAEDDFDAWADFLADGEATRLLHTPAPFTDPNQARAGLRRWIAMFGGGIGMYTVVVRATGETAGFVGFIHATIRGGTSSSWVGCFGARSGARGMRARPRGRFGHSCPRGSSR